MNNKYFNPFHSHRLGTQGVKVVCECKGLIHDLGIQGVKVVCECKGLIHDLGTQGVKVACECKGVTCSFSLQLLSFSPLEVVALCLRLGWLPVAMQVGGACTVTWTITSTSGRVRWR